MMSYGAVMFTVVLAMVATAAFIVCALYWQEKSECAQPPQAQPCRNCIPEFEGMLSEIESLKARVLQLERNQQDARPADLPLVGASLRRAIETMGVKDELGLPALKWDE
jgi:hypothetical protein